MQQDRRCTVRLVLEGSKDGRVLGISFSNVCVTGYPEVAPKRGYFWIGQPTVQNQ
jgi:hypothetical protein